jgi:hypothetical protein
MKTALFQEEEISQKIPHEYWVDATIDATRLISAERNEDIVTYALALNKRKVLPKYFDLEVQRKPVLQWAARDAAKYRGEADGKVGRG